MQRKEIFMKQETKEHEYLEAEYCNFDIMVSNENNDLYFYMHRIKEGLYSFVWNDTRYLLNTERDISLTSDYSFEVGNHIFTLKEHEKQKTLSYIKQ